VRKYFALVVLAALLFLASCVSKLSAQDFFRAYFNLDAVPEGISEFQGESFDTMPAFLGNGYFKYKASPAYFEMLAQHRGFREKSEFNNPIHETSCSELQSDFSYWTDESITKTDKQCFEGIFDFTKHLILYDPNTNQTWHLLQGIRD
jgi:hypothetical protein